MTAALRGHQPMHSGSGTSSDVPAMLSVLEKFGRLPRAARHKIWSFLYLASRKRAYGYRFLLANYAMLAYAKIGDILHRKRKHNDLDLLCKEIVFNEVKLQTQNREPLAGSTSKLALTTQAESIQGQAIIRHGLLVNGGDSVLLDGHFLCGRWRERSEGHSIKSTETDIHREAMSRGSILSEPILIQGQSLCLSGPWSDNYFHWLLQYLPILKIASQSIPLDNIDHFLVKGPIKSFQTESLSLFGIPPKKVIEVNAGEHYLAEELLITTIPCDNRTYDQWALDFLYALRKSSTAESSSVFFDRPFPTSRRMVNAEEVYAVLDNYGIQCIDCSKYSFADQVRFASSADLVLGVHGASLANGVFSAPGTTLLELTPRNYSPPYFRGLARACGLNYDRITGKEPGLLSTKVAIRNADILVPIDTLKTKLDRLYTH